jgi:hypothetical protein
MNDVLDKLELVVASDWEGFATVRTSLIREAIAEIRNLRRKIPEKVDEKDSNQID